MSTHVQVYREAPVALARHLVPGALIALGSVGYSATGGTFRLGQLNTAGQTTSLKSAVAGGPTFKANNTGGKPAGAFVTNNGVPPSRSTGRRR